MTDKGYFITHKARYEEYVQRVRDSQQAGLEQSGRKPLSETERSTELLELFQNLLENDFVNAAHQEFPELPSITDSKSVIGVLRAMSELIVEEFYSQEELVIRSDSLITRIIKFTRQYGFRPSDMAPILGGVNDEGPSKPRSGAEL